MDPRRYFLRPFEEGDYEAVAHIETKTNPEFPSNPDWARRWDRLLDAQHFVHEEWVVQERDTSEVVAAASIYHTPYSYDAHRFWASVVVDPGHLHRGIGRALAALLDAEAVAHRATCYWTNARKDDPRALQFAARQGFTELRTSWMSILDLSATAPTSGTELSDRLEGEGFRFSTLAREGASRAEVRQRLYDVDADSSRDAPRMGEFTPIPFAQFSAELDEPTIIPEAFFLAAHGDSYAASSHLERDLGSPDTLIVGYTGTRKEYRGRGLATELKRRSIEYARANGFRFLRTFNDSLNPPIWAINQKLGFRRVVEWSNQQRLFRSESTPGNPSPPP